MLLKFYKEKLIKGSKNIVDGIIDFEEKNT
jgi:hypothetical protein